jgi:polysaccharide export outer membrane protein
MAFRFTSAAVMVLISMGAKVAISQATEPVLPKELVQYVRQAKGQGATDAKIKKQAQAIGWPAPLVDAALVSVKDTKSSSDTAGVEAKFEAPAATPAELRPAVIPATPAGGTPIAVNVGTVQIVPDDYLIGAGDTLQISVWKETEVSVPAATVRPDGRITVPLIKEVAVAGLTPRQAEKVITDGLAKFITDANVTVVVTAMHSKKVFVIGAARKEGPLAYTYGMSVMQALSEAGGLTDYAKRKRIYILRTESGRQYRMDFNYDEAIRGERMDQNIVLLPDDTVVIPH